MRCLYPQRITIKPKSPKSPPSFSWVPCGKCYACKSNRRNNWTFRLQQEQLHSSFSSFVTLTYADEHLPVKYDWFCIVKTHEEINNSFVSVYLKDIQDFVKRYRYYLDLYDIKLRYLIASEYSPEVFRPHYHCIFFYSKYDPVIDKIEYDGKAFYNELLRKSWIKGNSTFDFLTDGRIHYVTQYNMKIFDNAPGNTDNNFCVMSRRPGIGYSFIEENKHLSSPFVYYNNGCKGSMPRYFRDRIGLRVDNNLDYYEEIENEYQRYLKRHKNATFKDFIAFRNNAINDTAKTLYNNLKLKHKL